MEHSKRLELFEKARDRYSMFLTSVLWKLTADKEIFAEAMQYALFAIWRHVEKLKDKTATSYIYKVALTANSKAWRNRIGRNGEIPKDLPYSTEDADERLAGKSWPLMSDARSADCRKNRHEQLSCGTSNSRTTRPSPRSSPAQRKGRDRTSPGRWRL